MSKPSGPSRFDEPERDGSAATAPSAPFCWEPEDENPPALEEQALYTGFGPPQTPHTTSALGAQYHPITTTSIHVGASTAATPSPPPGPQPRQVPLPPPLYSSYGACSGAAAATTFGGPFVVGAGRQDVSPSAQVQQQVPIVCHRVYHNMPPPPPAPTIICPQSNQAPAMPQQQHPPADNFGQIFPAVDPASGLRRSLSAGYPAQVSKPPAEKKRDDTLAVLFVLVLVADVAVSFAFFGQWRAVLVLRGLCLALHYAILLAWAPCCVGRMAESDTLRDADGRVTDWGGFVRRVAAGAGIGTAFGVYAFSMLVGILQGVEEGGGGFGRSGFPGSLGVAFGMIFARIPTAPLMACG